MFQFLFKYPPAVFSKGTFVLAASWPHWLLPLLAILLATGIGYVVWRRYAAAAWQQRKGRAVVLWLLQSSLLITLLLLLWQPAISVTELRPQQNIVAVVVDDSQSMAIKDEGAQSREQHAVELLNQTVLPSLRQRFQVRLYRLGDGLQRIGNVNDLHANEGATRIGNGLSALASEAGTVPVGAVVLLTDGADTSGGVDLQTARSLHAHRIAVNTIGFGSETLHNDLELANVSLPATALQKARLQARVVVRQNGMAGKNTTLVLTARGRVLASRDIRIANTPEQTEVLDFNSGRSGIETVQVDLRPLPGETNRDNNRLNRVLSVNGQKRRILYVEGEPRWDYKFLRRAAEDDEAIEVVSMLRTTQSKVYRQGIANPSELADGFPREEENLFPYQAIVLGSVESGYFSSAQQKAMEAFVDRRGGGLLFLGGRASLSDGDYNVQPFTDLLPVTLPKRKNTFFRSLAVAELTDEGRRSLLCRIEDDPVKNNDHWDVLPYLANYQDAGTPKPGAAVLARSVVSGKRYPLLITENYGRGRTAVFATGGAWRWRMQQPVTDTSEESFWRQLLRWTVAETPTPVQVTTSEPNLQDSGTLTFRAEVRDKFYRPTSNATVSANIVKPDGSSERLALLPDHTQPGHFVGEWNAGSTGAYVADVIAQSGEKELGRGTVPFQRQNGVAEHFHQQQDREFLQKLAEDSGGRYYTPANARRLTDEISFSDGGISARELKDLWDMPAIFLAILLLRGSEWILRRRWSTI